MRTVVVVVVVALGLASPVFADSLDDFAFELRRLTVAW